MEFPAQQLETIFNAHHPPPNPTFQYGTAGFRMKASQLDSIMVAVSCLAVLRSFACVSSAGLPQTIGIMITASHNPPEDNGVKIVDPMGDMLPQDWEPLATLLANCGSFGEFEKLLKPLWEKYHPTSPANIVIARDTRESGPKLLQICTQVFDALSSDMVTYTNFDELTTPELHYLTRTFNDERFGESSEAGYFRKLSTSFSELLQLHSVPTESIINVIVDAANGVGAVKLRSFIDNSPIMASKFKLVNANVSDPAALNVRCGADFVKTNQNLPAGIDTALASNTSTICASFDGDADRLVCYFYDKSDEKFVLLDGDKIAILLSTLISHLMNQLPKNDLKVGIIQTAYANGAATNYIVDTLKLPSVCAKTGVKHLHHEALKFDIGIYFEANGHGTVLFSDRFRNTMASLHDSDAAKSLLLLNDLINQTVGDALSDLLAVIAALSVLGKSPSDWANTYHDLPNKLSKVIVKDRNMFITTDAERQLVEPPIQPDIDQLISRAANGRSFVRPSGTEDAVRVYAEAATKEECDQLSKDVVKLVEQFS